MTKQKIVGIGAVGCGGFGLFAMEAFSKVAGAKLVAAADPNTEAAKTAKERFGVATVATIEELIARKDVDLVYISTPPFLHHAQTLAALKAGKHVICEKPLAMNLKEADDMIGTAKKQNLLMIANLMQRYNPVFEKVRQVVEQKLLGEPLHGYFENYACDENLGPKHWFWERSKSGGIIIEHGVHFFDLFAGWLGGPGKVQAAQRVLRPGSGIEEQVHCTARYGNVLVNFYHGFHQPKRMDRQEMRILFERGDVTLYEWVPTRVKIDGLVDSRAKTALLELFAGAKMEKTESYSGRDRACGARHKNFEVDEHMVLRWGDDIEKLPLYQHLLTSMLKDQLAWIGDQKHRRIVTEENGRSSLAMAEEASRITVEK